MNTSFKRRLCRVLAMGVVATGLAACGGGGGDSGGGIAYTGNTNLATITTANGAAMVTNAYSGGALGNDIGGLAGILTPPAESAPPAPPRTLALYGSLRGFMQRLTIADAAAVDISHAQRSFSDTIPSPEACGGAITPSGNAEVSFSYDDVSGDFSGNGRFNSYCEGGEQLSGDMRLSGTIDPNTEEFITLTITLDALTVVSDSDSFAVGGSVAMNGAPTMSVTMNLVMRDNNTQKTVWVRNLVFSFAETLSYVDITISGRFYDHDEGYIELATPTPLRIFTGATWPSAGTLIATGANNASATLTPLSGSSYQVDIDANGDSVTDSTETGNWDAL